MIHFPRKIVGIVIPNRKNAVRAVVTAVVVVSSRAANAHLVSTELGPLYDGAAHPLVSPQDLLTILGLAILASYGGATSGRRLIVSLTLAWGTGVGIGFAALDGQLEFPVATAAVILLFGILGLSRIRVPSGVLVPASAFIGLARGVMNGSAARAADGQWLSVVGVSLGVLVLGVILTGCCTWVAKRPAAVVLRVVGSWIAAIGLLMLGWELGS